VQAIKPQAGTCGTLAFWTKCTDLGNERWALDLVCT
jgi:hypothetical protein